MSSGNPNWIRGGPSPNPRGTYAARRIAAKNLAKAIRDSLVPAEAYWWLRCVAAGYDPDYLWDGKERVWERAAREYRVPIDGVLATVDWTARTKAMSMLLERGWGMPAQHVVVEAELRSLQDDETLATDVELQFLSDAQLEALQTLGRVRASLPPPVIIDAESE